MNSAAKPPQSPAAKPAVSPKPADSKQQKAGSGAGQEYGEGNYKATREYNAGLKKHMEEHDIEKEARDAAPNTPAEARELEAAEKRAASRARVMPSPDDAGGTR